MTSAQACDGPSSKRRKKYREAGCIPHEKCLLGNCTVRHDNGLMNRTRDEDSGDRVEYGSTTQPDGESETQASSRESSPFSDVNEALNTPGSSFSIGGGNPTTPDMPDEQFTLGVQKHVVQKQIPSGLEIKLEDDMSTTICGSDYLRQAFDFSLENWYMPDLFSLQEPIMNDYICSGSMRGNLAPGSSSNRGIDLTSSSIFDFSTPVSAQHQNNLSHVPLECSPTNSCAHLNEFYIQSPTAVSPEPIATHRSGSRKRNFSDSDNEEPPLSNRRRSVRATGREQPFACPFYKWDPKRHQDCDRYTLRRIKDVKQHIYRLHCKPELYCSRCFETFKCSNDRDYHVREGRCALKSMSNFDGITEAQKKLLKDCGTRGTKKTQQWMEIWEVIFPGVQHPRSPYLEDGRTELMSSMRTFWEHNASSIITNCFGGDAQYVHPEQVKNVIDSVFNHFGARWTEWDLVPDEEPKFATCN